MSKCKDERIGIGGNPGQPSFKIPLSSIKSILTMLKCAFAMTEAPLPFISPVEIANGVGFKNGLSKIKVLSGTLNSMKAAGIDTGPNTDASENMVNKHTKAIVDNILDNIIKDSRVECAIKAGTIIGYTAGGEAVFAAPGVQIHGIVR